MSLAEELPTVTNQGNDQSVLNTAQQTDPHQAMARSTQHLMRNQIVQAFNEEMPSNLLKPCPEEESKFAEPSSLFMQLDDRSGMHMVVEELHNQQLHNDSFATPDLPDELEYNFKSKVAENRAKAVVLDYGCQNLGQIRGDSLAVETAD